MHKLGKGLRLVVGLCVVMMTMGNLAAENGNSVFYGWQPEQTIIIAKGTDMSDWDNSWFLGCNAKIVLEP